MSTHKNIHEAINAIMDEVGYVKKSRAASLNYSFAGEAALISALRPSMVDHGVYMDVDAIHEVRRENYITAKGTAMVNTVIRASVKFTHISGDSIVVASVGEGSDSGDKSANKAMTGLYKYALRQTFCIETGDDPDKYPSEERAPEKSHRDQLIERYNKLLTDAEKHGLPILDYVINEKMTDDEIAKLGVELKTKLDAKKKEGK